MEQEKREQEKQQQQQQQQVGQVDVSAAQTLSSPMGTNIMSELELEHLHAAVLNTSGPATPAPSKPQMPGKNLSHFQRNMSHF